MTRQQEFLVPGRLNWKLICDRIYGKQIQAQSSLLVKAVE